jgi:signal transduction histidine kinase
MASSEERELRDALERAQQEAKELRGRIGELTAFKPEELLARIDELETTSTELRGRLEVADKVRTEWDARVQGLRRELEIARKEQERLRSLLENERLSKR